MDKITKDFDKWNIQKKTIHNSGTSKFYRVRELWWCNLGVNIGFEQDGTGDYNRRPVLVIKGFSREVCLIVPLTTSQKNNKYYLKIGMVNKKEASAIISQIRLIDTKRLIRKIGDLNKNKFEETKKAVRNLI